MRGDLARQARRLGIADRVLFLGNRPHEEVALWMNAADCLCLTSRSEGMPNVALEAVASGLPVVATDVGGVAELVGGGPEGLVVRAGGRDVAGRVAAALWDALRAPADRERMASRGARSHSWETQAERLIGLMRKGRTEAA
jgi:glycosyltransferase involved in cell wall biosynthesis